MISSSKIRSDADHKVSMKGVNILKHAVIYGANAAGKTNLVDFFLFFQNTLTNSPSLESRKWFCKSDEDNIRKDSYFEMQFTMGNRFYAYGFTSILAESRITSEWLYELRNGQGAICIFERELGKKRVKMGETIVLSEHDKSKLATYLDDFVENESSLFLAEINRNKRISKSSKLYLLKSIYQYLTENIIIVKPSSISNRLRYYNDDATLEVVGNLLSTFDTGINKVERMEIDLAEFRGMVPENVYNTVLADLRKEAMAASPTTALRCTLRGGRNFFTILVKGEEIVVYTLASQHKRSFYDFRFDEESDGTRRIFELIDILLNEDDDLIYIVDELERSLHPKLTQHFLELFMTFHKDNKRQLIFTTHESSIMDQRLFRRDEIWFVERGHNGASSVYSLDRFKERYDKVLGKAYLEGRYGAIPVFSSFEEEEE